MTTKQSKKPITASKSGSSFQLSTKKINEVFSIFSAINPHPKIELEHTNVFTLLVAVALSAQTTDKIVNKCTTELFKTYDTPQKMLDLGSERISEIIKPTGFFNSKTKNLIKMCQQLVQHHNGKVPNKFEDLTKLAGVGRKTADVVLNTGFGKHTIAVDRHIFRISHRIGLAQGKDASEVADNLTKNLPKKWHKFAHHWLVLHGRYICKAQKPQCKTCPINHICLSYS